MFRDELLAHLRGKESSTSGLWIPTPGRFPDGLLRKVEPSGNKVNKDVGEKVGQRR